MTDFIGSRISLLSKSDIRYVGTLHEINSESSTVALEQVVSYGTEGRRNNPDEEIAPADSVYEYIVFRGSDVKDLRIEEPPKENLPPPQVPNDPAILGSGTRPPQAAGPPQAPAPFDAPQTHSGPQFPGQAPYPYFYPPPQGGRGGPPGGPPGPPPRGPPGPPGYPNASFGGPPGWYPPPGQGFPAPPGPFGPGPGPMQYGGPSQPQGADRSSSGGPVTRQERENGAAGSSQRATPAPHGQAPSGPAPPPPVESKPDVATALAPAKPAAAAGPASDLAAPTGPKSGRIVPAVPRAKANAPAANHVAAPLQGNAGNVGPAGRGQVSQAAANAAIQSATQAATAAVAAAMAKLPPAPGSVAGQRAKQSGEMDQLARQVNDMRTNDHGRGGRQSGGAGAHAAYRGGRGRGGHQQVTRKVEVPKTDYDFQSANAKFNKQDLVKEVIATGSAAGTPTEGSAPDGLGEAVANGGGKETDVVIPPAPYNKSTSFFDNISSEMKDRSEGNGQRPGGREWRGEETKRNLETFGQGSVDGGYRGGFRGRGRGRGMGHRGRGGGHRGGFRGRSDGQPGAPNGSVAATT